MSVTGVLNHSLPPRSSSINKDNYIWNPCPEVVNDAISLIHPGERLTLRNVITHVHTRSTWVSQEPERSTKRLAGKEGIITRKQLAHSRGSRRKTTAAARC